MKWSIMDISISNIWFGRKSWCIWYLHTNHHTFLICKEIMNKKRKVLTYKQQPTTFFVLPIIVMLLEKTLISYLFYWVEESGQLVFWLRLRSSTWLLSDCMFWKWSDMAQFLLAMIVWPRSENSPVKLIYIQKYMKLLSTW